MKVELTREEFEHKTRHLVEKCKTICEIVMQEAKMNWSDIDKVLLVGGMTRMPMVREMISQLSSVPVVDDVNPDEAVAVGAAIQAILSLLHEEEVSGEKIAAGRYAPAIFLARRRPDSGDQHHLAHARRGAVG